MSVQWRYEPNARRDEAYCPACNGLRDTPYFSATTISICERCARVLVRCVEMVPRFPIGTAGFRTQGSVIGAECERYLTEEERQVDRAVDFVVALHKMQGHVCTQDERDGLKREAMEIVGDLLPGEAGDTNVEVEE